MDEPEERPSQTSIKIRRMSTSDGDCQMCWYDSPQENVVTIELVGPTGIGSVALRLCEQHRIAVGTCLIGLADSEPFLEELLEYGKSVPWEEVKQMLDIA